MQGTNCGIPLPIVHIVFFSFLYGNEIFLGVIFFSCRLKRYKDEKLVKAEINKQIDYFNFMI